jgi:hypothetical protein
MVYRTCLINSIHIWWRVFPLSCRTRRRNEDMPDGESGQIWKCLNMEIHTYYLWLLMAYIDLSQHHMHTYLLTCFPAFLMFYVSDLSQSFLTHCWHMVSSNVSVPKLCQIQIHNTLPYNVPVVVIVNETLNTYTWSYNIILTCIEILGRQQWTQSQTYILTNELLFHLHLSLLFW